MLGKLNIRYCFGLNPSACGGVIGIPEERAILYQCGAHIVLLHTETREQSFLPIAMTGKGAVSYGKKVIAVADGLASVHLFDATSLRKKKILSFPPDLLPSNPSLASSTSTSSESGAFKCIALSEDGRLCVAQSGAPDWTLVLWNIEKSAKVVASTRLSLPEDAEVSHVAFCPWDASVVIALGRGVFRLFRLQEGQFKPATLNLRRDSANFLSYLWLKSSSSNGTTNNGNALVVGTEAGEILLIENLEFRAVLYPLAETPPSSLTPIYALGAMSSGAFLAGTSNATLRYFTRSNITNSSSSSSSSKEVMFQFSGSYHVREVNADVLSIVMNSDDSFCMGTSSQQLLVASINHLKAAKDSVAEAEALVTSFHGPGMSNRSAVTGLDIALWRSILVSCGRDGTVRVWSLADRKIEILKRFIEEPLGLSLHPSGVYLVVVFEDRVRIMSILQQDLFVFKEILLKNCSMVKFARGGNHFAVVSGFTILIFNTYTGAQVSALKGHLVEVCCLSWIALDSKLISMGVDGVIYTWDVVHGNKIKEEHTVSTPLVSAVTSSKGDRIYAPFADRRLRQLSLDTRRAALASTSHDKVGLQGQGKGGGLATTATMHGANKRYITEEVKLPQRGRCLLLDETRQMLFIGSTDEDRPGAVMMASVASSSSLLLPSATSDEEDTITSVSSSRPVINFLIEATDLHSSPISAMCISADGALFFSADESGCICISDILDPGTAALATTTTKINTTLSSKGSSANVLNKSSTIIRRSGSGAAKGLKEEMMSPFELVDEVLIHQSELERGKSVIAQLEDSLRELVLSNDYQLRSKELEHAEQIREASAKFSEQLKNENLKLDMLVEERAEIECNYANRMDAGQSQSVLETAALETKYQAKIKAEALRLEELTAEMEAAERVWDLENAQLLANHKTAIATINADSEIKIATEREQRRKVSEESAVLRAQYERRRLDLEEDADEEALSTKAQFEQRLAQESKAGEDLVDVYALAKKELLTLQKEHEQQKEECKKLRDKEGRLLETVRSLEKDIHGQKKEIREREETVTDKEKRIFDLKKKNQELEKFRFVLDYKIKELKLQIVPREQEITSMRKQIEEMDLELEQYHKSNEALRMMISELELKHEGLKGELRTQTERVQSGLLTRNRIERDIRDLEEVMNDKNLLKVKFVELFRGFVQSSSTLAGDASSSSSATERMRNDVDDPRALYNRDREQMERNLESVRRALRTDSTAHKRDFEKMMRENVVLKRELNELRKEHHDLDLQKGAVDAVLEQGLANADLPALFTLLGLTSTGKVISANDKSVDIFNNADRNEALAASINSSAWREVEMQNQQMLALEAELKVACKSAGISASELLRKIDMEVFTANMKMAKKKKEKKERGETTTFPLPPPPASR